MALLARFLRAWRGLTQLKRASSLLVDPVWQAALKHWSSALRVGRPVELRDVRYRFCADDVLLAGSRDSHPRRLPFRMRPDSSATRSSFTS